MKFPGKNLNIFTPKTLAFILFALATVLMFGFSFPNYVVFAIGEFRVTLVSLLTLALGAAVLIDARR